MAGRPQPVWNGSAQPGGTLLLTCRRGLTASLRFIRFAPLVKARFKGKVIVEAPAGAAGLFATCRGIDGTVVGDEECPAEFQLPVESAPEALGGVTAIPAEFPYFYPARNGDPVRQADEANPERPRVALVGIDFNTGSGAGDFAAFEVVLTQPETADLAHAAAVLLQFDLIVTADALTAHLAGSLGLPCWVATADFGDFERAANRAETPWYPTLRIFGPGRDGGRLREALTRIPRVPRFRLAPHRRRLHRFEINGIELLAYDEPDSLAAPRIAIELLEDAYGLDAISFQRGDVAIDIGSHVGLVSMYLAKRWPFLEIYAFEPHPANWANCAENLLLNDIRNVSLSREALSGDRRRLTLHTNAGNSGGASAVFTLPDSQPTAEVNSVTLRDVFGRVLQPGQRCRLLKIDCEGMEYEILGDCSELDRVDYLAGEFHEDGQSRRLEDPRHCWKVAPETHAAKKSQRCILPEDGLRTPGSELTSAAG